MNDELLLNTSTQLAMHRFLGMPSHALIILGPNGAGKTYIARSIAAKLLGVDADKLTSQTGYREFEPSDGSLGIESIRSIQTFLKLRTTGHQVIRRVCLILNAQCMTQEAQNALLKTLEEPPEDTVFVLTATPTLNLKETIYSRTQRLVVKPVDEGQAVAHFVSRGYDQEFVTRSYRISGGLIGLMTALIEEDTQHRLVQKIDQAKQLLGQTKFERLAHLDSLGKDRGDLAQLLFALKRVTQSALDQAVHKSRKDTLRLAANLKLINSSELGLEQFANTKLLLTNLLLAL